MLQWLLVATFPLVSLTSGHENCCVWLEAQGTTSSLIWLAFRVLAENVFDKDSKAITLSWGGMATPRPGGARVPPQLFLFPDIATHTFTIVQASSPAYFLKNDATQAK
jgi:hypothetical protein